MLTPRLLHDSGGLIYHARAWRYASTLWQPFCHAVAAWLATWPVGKKPLLIVGPSAGYTLPAAWLHGFSQIDILEPDPIARWLLQRRFPHSAFCNNTFDCFASLDGPAELAQRYPTHAILFSNVIGQLLNEAYANAWKAALNAALSHHHWASYHDIASTTRAPNRQAPLHVMAEKEASLEDILAAFWHTPEITIRDHLCHRLSSTERDYAVWSITPRQHHLIGWCCAAPLTA